MADQKQQQQQHRSSKTNVSKDDPRHAPESGEKTETGRVDEQGARGDKAGDRDESGRQGRG
jgi:hypothetical protein